MVCIKKKNLKKKTQLEIVVVAYVLSRVRLCDHMNFM